MTTDDAQTEETRTAEPMERRALFAKLAGAAAAGVSLVAVSDLMTPQPASASDGGNFASSDGNGIVASTSADSSYAGVYGISVNGTGVVGRGGTDGVAGSAHNSGNSGVYGNHSGDGYGVYGQTGSSGSGLVGAQRAGALGDSNTAYGVLGASGSADGVRGVSASADGVHGVTAASGKAGVAGINTVSGGYGVYGSSPGVGVAGVSSGADAINGATSATGHAGVAGNNSSANGFGVFGGTQGNSGFAFPAAGVVGNSHDAVGVAGLSAANDGVAGTSSATGHSGVFGLNTSANGWGVVGATQGFSNLVGTTRAGVVGDSSTARGVLGASDSGVGVQGITNTGSVGLSGQAIGNGDGVSGLALGTGNGVAAISSHGYGVRAAGAAQLLLVPNPTTGAPTSGTFAVGAIYADSAGSLFVCTGAGSPGTWQKVAYGSGGGGGGGFTPVNPTRIIDTRPGNPPDNPGEHRLAADEELLVSIAGVGDISESATAVVLNVTAVAPGADGFLSLYPADQTHNAGNRPNFSNVNFAAGVAAVANTATVRVAPSGPNAGRIKVFARSAADVILDVAGYYS